MVVAESMMNNRISIISSNCGFRDFITDGQDGFIFNSEDYKELSELIGYVMDNVESVLQMGKKARAIYEKYFTKDYFVNNFKGILASLS